MYAVPEITILVFALVRMAEARKYIRDTYIAGWLLMGEDREGPRYIPRVYRRGMCTHIFYAFADIGEEYTIQPDFLNSNMEETMYKDVTDMRREQPDLKVLLSFGGWTISHRRGDVMRDMLKSPELRGCFIASIIGFVRKHNFDGFDFDYEPCFPSGEDQSECRDGLVSFMRELRRAVDEEAEGDRRMLLTVAVCDYFNEFYDVKCILDTFDFVNVMSYDYAVGSGVTMLNCALYPTGNSSNSVSGSVGFWMSSGLPKEKIVLGFPAYGRGWMLSDKNVRGIGAPIKGLMTPLAQGGEPGVASYREILCFLRESTVEVEMAREARGNAPYLIRGDMWLSYEDVESFKTKLYWLKERELGGAFVWNLNHDDFAGENGEAFPLHRTIAKELLDTQTSPDVQPEETTSSEAVSHVVE